MTVERTMRPYEPRGRLLAVDPRAFLELFFCSDGPPVVDVTPDGIAVVPIMGPLESRSSFWGDSYEAILERVTDAFDNDDVRAVMLRIDSPGGDVTGCFDTARALRSIADQTGKPLYAYLDRACSAAYAIASSARMLFTGDASAVGSIGVLATRPDVTAANAQRGVKIDLIASSERKLDGNPETPITDAERADTQECVDGLAQTFFELVAEHRAPLSAAGVEALQARVFYGEAARRAGLVDRITDYDAALQTLRAMKGKTTMGSDYEKARDFLQRAAEGDDANAAAAKRALDALGVAAEGDGPGDDDEDKTEPEGETETDEPAAEGDAGAAAEGETDEPEAVSAEGETDDTKPKKTSAAGTARPTARRSTSANGELSALAEVHKLRAEIEERDRRQERARLIASRPDFDPALRKVLAKAPLATVRDMVKSLPRTKVAGAGSTSRAGKPGSTVITTVAGVQGGSGNAGHTNDGAAPGADESLDAELDRRMGLTSMKLGVRREGTTQSLGIVEAPREATAAGSKGKGK